MASRAPPRLRAKAQSWLGSAWTPPGAPSGDAHPPLAPGSRTHDITTGPGPSYSHRPVAAQARRPARRVGPHRTWAQNIGREPSAAHAERHVVRGTQIVQLLVAAGFCDAVISRLHSRQGGAAGSTRTLVQHRPGTACRLWWYRGTDWTLAWPRYPRRWHGVRRTVNRPSLRCGTASRRA